MMFVDQNSSITDLNKTCGYENKQIQAKTKNSVEKCEKKMSRPFKLLNYKLLSENFL